MSNIEFFRVVLLSLVLYPIREQKTFRNLYYKILFQQKYSLFFALNM